MLHISEIAQERVKDIKEWLREGQVVRVKVLQADDKGRLRLSLKAALADEGGTIAPLSEQTQQSAPDEEQAPSQL